MTPPRRIASAGVDDPRDSRAHIFAWIARLDDLTYYELFGVPAHATDDEVRAAFHRFCDSFHPDRHFARVEEERAALSKIFKRATEAYLVLSDRGLREQYDGHLASSTLAQPPRMSSTPRTRPSGIAPGARPSLETAARSPSSRPFARRAQELLDEGDLRRAKLQLVMANHLDPDNDALQAALRELEARLASPK